MSALRQPDYRNTLNYAEGSNADIIETVHKEFPRAVQQTKDFARRFRAGSARQTAHNIWKFLKEHITYKRDTPDKQLIRLPSRFISDQEGDCKSYALAAAALLANNGLPVKFRYANYRGGKIPSHIYTVTNDENGREIIVDGVWKYFDSEKKPSYKFDRTMKIYTLSGIEDISTLPFKAVMRAQLKRNPALRKKLIALRRSSPAKFQAVMQRQRKRHAMRKHYMNKKYTGSLRQMINGIEEDYQEIGKLRLGKFFKKIGKGIKKVAKKVGAGVKQAAKATGQAFKKVGKAVAKVGKAIWTGAKKIALAPGRRAFRTLVALNVKGLARKLKRVYDKDPGALDSKWKSIGGKPSELRKSVKAGYNRWATKHKKQPMTGIYGCDIPELHREAVEMGICGTDDPIGALPAILAVAAPVFAALLKLLKSKGEDPDVPESEEAPVTDIISNVTDAVHSFNQNSLPEGMPELIPPDYAEADPTSVDNVEQFDTQQGVPDTPATEAGTGLSLDFNKIWPFAAVAGVLLLARKN